MVAVIIAIYETKNGPSLLDGPFLYCRGSKIGLRLLKLTSLKVLLLAFSKILWTSQLSSLNLYNKIGYKNLVSGGGHAESFEPA